jgi:1-acyl-sn-glycerol-3-phosphate acyltransferase
MATIKTVSKFHISMTEAASLAEAWQSLEEHWLIPTTGQTLPRTPSYGFLRMFVSPFLRPLLNAKLNGLHHIPRKGAVILAANHLSHVDPIFVIASARRTTHYLAKDGHFKNSVMRFAMRATGQIETKRDKGGEGALSSAADVLDSGQALGIFPEGTRSKRSESPYLISRCCCRTHCPDGNTEYDETSRSQIAPPLATNSTLRRSRCDMDGMASRPQWGQHRCTTVGCPFSQGRTRDSGFTRFAL